MTLLSGCTTKYVDAINLPKANKPSAETIRWLDKNKAPNIVIEDFADCIVTSEIIKNTNEIDEPIETKFDKLWSIIISISETLVSFVRSVF